MCNEIVVLNVPLILRLLDNYLSFNRSAQTCLGTQKLYIQTILVTLALQILFLLILIQLGM